MGTHETSEKAHRKALLLTFYAGANILHTQRSSTSYSTENERIRSHSREKIFSEEQTNNTYGIIIRQNNK